MPHKQLDSEEWCCQYCKEYKDINYDKVVFHEVKTHHFGCQITEQGAANKPNFLTSSQAKTTNTDVRGYLEKNEISNHSRLDYMKPVKNMDDSRDAKDKR
jgi:hypothetical protein